jgi:nitroimidazol reductase NimA-like FMN-containing flavoprotein (pyridoxamine 5'-phosphate oxidase superfamily)
MATRASTPRRVRRHPERGAYDRDTINAILDEALFCHLAYVVDGEPEVIPTIHARAGDTLYVHGSTASRTLKAIDGQRVCVVVTLLDGLVMARSVFNHSMNYRSVIAYGEARLVTEQEEKWEAQRVLVEHVARGRSEDARMPNDKELKQTAIVAIPIDEAAAKVRTGPPKDDPEDLGLDVWAGLIPMRLTPGDPEPAPDLQGSKPVPPNLKDYRRP